MAIITVRMMTNSRLWGNGTQAFAIIADSVERENYLKNAEMAMEDDYGMIDSIINNGET